MWPTLWGVEIRVRTRSQSKQSGKQRWCCVEKKVMMRPLLCNPLLMPTTC